MGSVEVGVFFALEIMGCLNHGITKETALLWPFPRSSSPLSLSKKKKKKPTLHFSEKLSLQPSSFVLRFDRHLASFCDRNKCQACLIGLSLFTSMRLPSLFASELAPPGKILSGRLLSIHSFFLVFLKRQSAPPPLLWPFFPDHRPARHPSRYF
jgi:hypothetical protein